MTARTLSGHPYGSPASSFREDIATTVGLAANRLASSPHVGSFMIGYDARGHFTAIDWPIGGVNGAGPLATANDANPANAADIVVAKLSGFAPRANIPLYNQRKAPIE